MYSNIINLKTTLSTNSYAKDNLPNLPNGTIIFAEEQTAGRGKSNRKWIGKTGCSIFCSLISKGFATPVDAIRYNFKFSLVIREALSRFTDKDNFRLKWPNDILAKPNKKICGILSEFSNNSIITGIGINVKEFDFPTELQQNAICLESVANKKIALEQFKNTLIEITNNFVAQTAEIPLNQFPQIWFDEAEIRDLSITVNDNPLITSGIIRGITDYGALIINDCNKTEHIITTGDIIYHDQL